jgi:hypothetical protein
MDRLCYGELRHDTAHRSRAHPDRPVILNRAGLMPPHPAGIGPQAAPRYRRERGISQSPSSSCSGASAYKGLARQVLSSPRGEHDSRRREFRSPSMMPPNTRTKSRKSGTSSLWRNHLARLLRARSQPAAGVNWPLRQPGSNHSLPNSLIRHLTVPTGCTNSNSMDIGCSPGRRRQSANPDPAWQ